MGMSVCPTSPKYGYSFDEQEHDVRKARKKRQCEGGRTSRASHFPGPRVEGCTDFIEVGDVYVATILNMFSSESSACLPCALAVGAIKDAACVCARGTVHGSCPVHGHMLIGMSNKRR